MCTPLRKASRPILISIRPPGVSGASKKGENPQEFVNYHTSMKAVKNFISRPARPLLKPGKHKGGTLLCSRVWKTVELFVKCCLDWIFKSMLI
ncbi:hypothetical protein NITGR_90052 [Nitrospina gracilis 3/211]|uniref:Uncharacterized protein n=1 Tax=Nitrospina gracilis (strain 3/211) TaxID=1266370 RepID=M1Z1M7_NITG3|nr:hypothetical protein NITGR_90052 [Nitrospina gracilis 3/211]